MLVFCIYIKPLASWGMQWSCIVLRLNIAIFSSYIIIMLGLYVGLLSAIASFLGRRFPTIFRTSKPASDYA